jgi:hypothetical protein
VSQSREILVASILTLLAMGVARAQSPPPTGPPSAEERLQEDPGPRALISTAYTQYSFIQLCHQVRQDYAIIDFNDDELQRARTTAKTIEKAAIAEDPTINPDKEFAEADELARSTFSDGEDKERIGELCRAVLNALLSSSPVSPYQTHRP